MANLRKIALPEIEDAKTRRKYEYDLVKALKHDEEKKGSSSYKKLVFATDEQLQDVAMICYDNGWSLDPADSEILLSVVFSEDEDGNEIVTLVDIVELYGATLKKAMSSGLYSHIETDINGNISSSEVSGLTDIITTKAFRIDGEVEVTSMTVAEIIEHAIEYSPSVKAKNPKEFFENWQKAKNGDKKFTGYWYTGFISMAKKTVLRKAVRTDKTSSYSEDYLNALRNSTIESFNAQNIDVGMNDNTVKKYTAIDVKNSECEVIDVNEIPMLETSEEVEI